MLNLTETRSPLSRHQYLPGHFTASGFVLPPQRDAFLLVWHPKLEMWVQPGGHIERDDPDPLAAARREVREETGLGELTLERPGIFDLDVHEFPPRGDAPAHEHFDLRFLLTAPSRQLGVGSHRAAWVLLEDVDRGDPSLTRPARKAQLTS